MVRASRSGMSRGRAPRRFGASAARRCQPGSRTTSVAMSRSAVPLSSQPPLEPRPVTTEDSRWRAALDHASLGRTVLKAGVVGVRWPGSGGGCGKSVERGPGRHRPTRRSRLAHDRGNHRHPRRPRRRRLPGFRGRHLGDRPVARVLPFVARHLMARARGSFSGGAGWPSWPSSLRTPAWNRLAAGWIRWAGTSMATAW